MNASAGSTDGRRSRWDEHKHERRMLILDAAIAVIEESAPDARIQVEQIARRAGLGRSVLYRHFTDRADLDRAVQTRVLDEVRGRLSAQFVLEGSIDAIILRIVSTYVDWADQHSRLHEFVVRDSAGTGDPLQGMIEALAADLSGLVSLGAAMLGVELDADDTDALDPLTAGLVGLAVNGARVWLARPERRPDAATLARLLSDTIWYLIDGHARARGVTIDPHLPLEDLVEAAWTAARP